MQGGADRQLRRNGGFRIQQFVPALCDDIPGQVLFGQFFYTSSILMGVYWLSIFGILIVSYYAAYAYRLVGDQTGMGRLFIAAAVILLMGVSILFSNNVSIMQMPEIWSNYFANRDGWMRKSLICHLPATQVL